MQKRGRRGGGGTSLLFTLSRHSPSSYVNLFIFAGLISSRNRLHRAICTTNGSQSVSGRNSIDWHCWGGCFFAHFFAHYCNAHNSLFLQLHHWTTLLQRFAVDAAAAVVLLVAPFALSFFSLTHFLLSVCLSVLISSCLYPPPPSPPLGSDHIILD